MYDARCARPPTGMGRLDYWGGVERYIYNRSGPAYQIVPTSADGDTSEETCFISGENYEPVSLFPDLTYFPTEPDSTDCELNGVACASYTLRSPTYNETTGFDGNYTLTVDAKDGTPLRFHFTGFNVILGSHYDEYIFDYLKVVPSFDDPETPAWSWKPPPALECEVLETDDDDSGGPTLADQLKEKTKELKELKEGGLKGPLKKRPKPDLGLPLRELKGLFPGGLQERSKRFESWAATHGKKFPKAAEKVKAKAKEILDEKLHQKHLEEEEEEAAGKNKKEDPMERFHRASQHHSTELFVNAMNRRRLPYWLTTNHMADWTREERKKRATGRLHTPKGTVVPATRSHEVKSKEGDLPTEIDWRAKGAVTPPKDQVRPTHPDRNEEQCIKERMN